METFKSETLTNPTVKKINDGLFLLFSEETKNVPCGVFSSIEEVSKHLYGNQLELFDLSKIISIIR